MTTNSPIEYINGTLIRPNLFGISSGEVSYSFVNFENLSDYVSVKMMLEINKLFEAGSSGSMESLVSSNIGEIDSLVNFDFTLKSIPENEFFQEGPRSIIFTEATAKDLNGDGVPDRNGSTFSYLGDGFIVVVLSNISQKTFFHEMLHCFGLDHDPVSGNVIPAEYDSKLYTVMSTQKESEEYWHTVGPAMMMDILALSRGGLLSETYNSGDTPYTFDENFSASMKYQTIYDTSGVDTIFAEGNVYSTNQFIDLRSGTYSSIFGGVRNLSISYQSIIENAVTGSGDDLIIGNQADNIIKSGSGNDRVFGDENALEK